MFTEKVKIDKNIFKKKKISIIFYLLEEVNAETPLSIRARLFDDPSMLAACLVCITCARAPDVSHFWQFSLWPSCP